MAIPKGLPLALTLALAFTTTPKTCTLTQNNISVITGTIGLTAIFVRDQARTNYFKISSHFENPIPLQLEEILSSDIIGLLKKSIVINSVAFESVPEDGQITFTVDLDRRNFMDLRKNEPLKVFPFRSDRTAISVVIEKEKSKWRLKELLASKILGQSAVQLVITLALLYRGNDILGYTTPEETSNLQTIIFVFL
ncbi:hypothetical protein Glove_508g47 [Diversispora epigaea]|uniref:Uncharacterized protein n=1 Tax=Diversispora epigaea TaxID=1348612 RepID=A0A397GHM4_9GLOM|nr:hypothetical protein Glove_508g47 [Diversispora epigaea]